MGKSNHSFEQKPLVFLAFANDRVSHVRYLRNLPEEQRGLRNALEKAKQAGLCEIIERANATIDDILDVFQDESYKDRIAVFHYGGHADCYKLLLESSNGSRSNAFKEGLVSFLSGQKGLKLIFLNGCSTEQHALELKQAGIPAVISTSQNIDDTVAMTLAIRFYNGIANGHSLERAWREAEDDIKTRKDSAKINNMYHWEHQEGPIDNFPWSIHFKEGAEKVKEWNLPDAVNDPLFGIPGIPNDYGMPETPFRFLQRFEEKYARVFFGRGFYIRGLYNRVTDPDSPPIVLFYGQSGVGKSSLLEAGLIPRLKETHKVVYAVRDRQKGLLGTLEEGLRQPGDSHHSSFSIQHSISLSLSRPLVIILDQVEEVFTCPNPGIANELNDFLEKLSLIFDSSHKGPKIKLILGYRKEYHPEIDKHLGNFGLPRSYLFLEPLCRREIIETITGISLSPVLKQRYHNLEIEPELPGIIADNLLEDKNSPVAPVLQILLTKMWMMAIKENSYRAVFSVKNYRELRRQGLAMEDFLQQQMAELKGLNPEVVNSGLALDLLKFHTTSLGTASGRNMDEIRQTYNQNWEMMGELVKQLKHLYLLTDTQRRENETSLAHDTLAPVVIKEYNDSDKPGQRTARILAAKIEDFKKDSGETWLNEGDLLVIEQGKDGMRALIPIEEELLKQSITRKAQREKQIKRFKAIRMVLLILVVIAGLTAGWQWQVAANRAREINLAYRAAQAQLNVEKDPTISLRLVEKAWKPDKKNTSNTAAICKIYRENNFYRIIARPTQEIKSVGFSSDGQCIISCFHDGTSRTWDLQGKEIADMKAHTLEKTYSEFFPGGQYPPIKSEDGTIRLWDEKRKNYRDFVGHEGRVRVHTFSPDEKYVLTGSEDKTARLWDWQGNPLEVFRGHESAVTSVAFSPDGRYILTAAGNILRLWELKDKELKSFDGHGGEVDSAVFSSDGQHLLTGSTDGIVRLWDMKSNQFKSFNNTGPGVAAVAFSPGDKHIMAGFKDGTVWLWEVAGKDFQPIKIKEKGAEISAVAFSPDGQRVLIGSYDKTARLLDLNGKEIQLFKGHKHRVTAAVFSPDGQYILTGSYDNTACLWNAAGKRQQVFEGHNKFVTSVAFSPDGKYILTGSFDQTARLWYLKGKELTVFKGHEDIVHSVAFSPDGQNALTGSADKTACVWDLQGNQIQVFKGHGGAVLSVGFSPDGRSVLSGSIDGTVRLWKIYPLEEFLTDGTCGPLSPEQLKKYGLD